MEEKRVKFELFDHQCIQSREKIQILRGKRGGKSLLEKRKHFSDPIWNGCLSTYVFLANSSPALNGESEEIPLEEQRDCPKGKRSSLCLIKSLFGGIGKAEKVVKKGRRLFRTLIPFADLKPKGIPHHIWVVVVVAILNKL